MADKSIFSSMADLTKIFKDADKFTNSIEESLGNAAKSAERTGRGMAQATGQTTATVANQSAGSVTDTPGFKPGKNTTSNLPPGGGKFTSTGTAPANTPPVSAGITDGKGGFDKIPGLGAIPILGGVARATYQAMPTVNEAFQYEYLRNRAAFKGMGANYTESANMVKNLAGQGIVNDPLDAARGLNESGALGNNNAGISRSLAIGTNISPGIGMTGAAQGLTALNQGNNVNMLRMIGINVRDGATGSMRELDKIINDLWSSLNRQKRGGSAISKSDLRLSLQPGNALASMLDQYFGNDPYLRKIVEEGLYAKASGVTDFTSHQQLIDKGVLPDGILSKSKRDAAAGQVIDVTTNSLVQGFEAANAVARTFSTTLASLARMPVFHQIMNVFGFTKGSFDTLAGMGNGLGGALLDAIPGLAEGGPTAKQNAYIVGERGPELFIPKTDGKIVPNHALSASDLNFAGFMHKGGDVTTTPGPNGSHSHPQKDKGTPHKHGITAGGGGVQISHEALRGILRTAGWKTDEDIENGIRIISKESGRVANKENFEGADMSYGLFQINMKNDVPGNVGQGNRRRASYAKYGVHEDWDLYDPIKNARAAWAISSEGRNYKPWSTAAAAGLNGPKYGRPRIDDPWYNSVVGKTWGVANKAVTKAGDVAGGVVDAVGNAVSGVVNTVGGAAGNVYDFIKGNVNLAKMFTELLNAIKSSMGNLALAGAREHGGPVSGSGGGYNINYGGVTVKINGANNMDERKLAQEIKKTLDYDALIRKVANH